eukprot:CAMPEP_0113312902 /NCGR_PEP_ID=MMETSP0010_2-20120614/9547_1 /TAXON_ID=216773 ORGANISM="Corethron hystrix, Strain 308" /NCGR_SAMPLE_ID=MMETSP0010_2 /ASSEMBLY_ACC=CAM_ASM_000155 /LENGTH=183 /DNA_ID=CAMNT_0000168821 /DNA_START=76 /DNA_END=627 /DNA_ORIENTATION=+ /assembly_acc=CAM_ASM_000155
MIFLVWILGSFPGVFSFLPSPRLHARTSALSPSSVRPPAAAVNPWGNPCASTAAKLSAPTALCMAAVSQKEAQRGIDKVVGALRRDGQCLEELGNLVKVTNVLGFGSPRPGTLAVRFNAQFKKGGKGMSSIPLPFGLGQSNKSEGRGVMVGQVKASIDTESGKIKECSVFRDLGYGRAFNLTV